MGRGVGVGVGVGAGIAAGVAVAVALGGGEKRRLESNERLVAGPC